MADSSSSADYPQLKPLGQHADKPAIRIHRPVFMIGSRHSAHLHLLSRQVGKAHALILKDDQGIYLRDLCSRNHVYVNTQPVTEALLKDGDQIKVGSFTFRLLANGFDEGETRLLPPGRIDIAGRNGPVLLEERVLLIGRRDACHVPVDDPSVSTEHAVIFAMGGAWYLRDLGSRTGTFLNDQQIHQKPLTAGDRIRIGPAEMRFEPSLEVPAGTAEEVEELDLLAAAGLEPDEEPIAVATTEAEPLAERPPPQPQPHAVTEETEESHDDLLALAAPDAEESLPVESVEPTESIDTSEPAESAPPARPLSPIEEAIPLEVEEAEPAEAAPPPQTVAPAAEPTDHADRIAIEQEDGEDALLVDGELQSHRLSSSAISAIESPPPDALPLEEPPEPENLTVAPEETAEPDEPRRTWTQPVTQSDEAPPSSGSAEPETVDAAPPSEPDLEPLPRRGWRRSVLDQGAPPPSTEKGDASDGASAATAGPQAESAPVAPPVISAGETEVDVEATQDAADTDSAPAEEVNEPLGVDEPELADLAAASAEEAAPVAKDDDAEVELLSLDSLADIALELDSPPTIENEIEIEPLEPAAPAEAAPFELTVATAEGQGVTPAAVASPSIPEPPSEPEIELLQPEVVESAGAEEIALSPLDLNLDEPEPTVAGASEESSAGDFDFSNLKLDFDETPGGETTEDEGLGLELLEPAAQEQTNIAPIAAADTTTSEEREDFGLELLDIPDNLELLPEPPAAQDESAGAEAGAGKTDDAVSEVIDQAQEPQVAVSADVEPAATDASAAAAETDKEATPAGEPDRRTRRAMPLRGPDGKFIKRRKAEKPSDAPSMESAAPREIKSPEPSTAPPELESLDELTELVSEPSADAIADLAFDSPLDAIADLAPDVSSDEEAGAAAAASMEAVAPAADAEIDSKQPESTAAAEPPKEQAPPADARSLMGLGTNVGGFFGGALLGFEKESAAIGGADAAASFPPPPPRMRHPFDWGTQAAASGARAEIPPYQEPRHAARATDFDALAMPPVRETDVFSQMPPAKMEEALLSGEIGDSSAAAPVLESMVGSKPPTRRPAPPQNPWPIAPPPPPPPAVPRRFRWFRHGGLLLGLMLLCMAAAAGGIWQLVDPQALVQGVLPFDGPQPTVYQRRQQVELLNDPHVRQAARKILQEEHVDGGFLNDDRVYKQFTANAQWSADGLMLSRSGNDMGGDQKRIGALLTALYHSPENQAMVDRQANLTRQVEDLQAKETEAKDVLRDLEHQIKTMEDNPPPVPTAEEQAAVTQQLVDLKNAWETGTAAPTNVAQENWLVAPLMRMLNARLAEARAASPGKDAEAQAAYLQTLLRQQKMQTQLAEARQYQHQLQDKRQQRRAAQSAAQLATQKRVAAQEKRAAALAPQSPALPNAVPLQDPRPTYILMCLGGIALVFMFLLLLTLLVGRDSSTAAWPRPQPAPRPRPNAQADPEEEQEESVHSSPVEV
jgi:pSer/pThr/pTyr-binding forkhead associated (FHA) protein